MKRFFYVVGQFIGYMCVLYAIVAMLIAIGYLLGCLISVHEDSQSTTSGVCTSTLCQ